MRDALVATFGHFSSEYLLSRSAKQFILLVPHAKYVISFINNFPFRRFFLFSLFVLLAFVAIVAECVQKKYDVHFVSIFFCSVHFNVIIVLHLGMVPTDGDLRIYWRTWLRIVNSGKWLIKMRRAMTDGLKWLNFEDWCVFRSTIFDRAHCVCPSRAHDKSNTTKMTIEPMESQWINDNDKLMWTDGDTMLSSIRIHLAMEYMPRGN